MVIGVTSTHRFVRVRFAILFRFGILADVVVVVVVAVVGIAVAVVTVEDCILPFPFPFPLLLIDDTARRWVVLELNVIMMRILSISKVT